MRLDAYLFAKGLAKSRTDAQRLVREGYVCIDGTPITKPSFAIAEVDASSDDFAHRISVDRSACPYVSRGGLKLEAALHAFFVEVTGAIALDIGASTGGFTDCLLSHGAAKVYAVDSGKAQLAPSLLQDSRVISMESYNARYMRREHFKDAISLAVMDVSFISQTLLHPALAQVLTDDGIFISLIKPQFEVGRSGICSGGIVRCEALRRQAVSRVCESMEACGFQSLGIIDSPITGGDGNHEFLACFRRT